MVHSVAQEGSAVPGQFVISSRMLFWAFRYALGRQSYVVDDVAKEVARCATLLPVPDRDRMLLEIAEARAADRIGMRCDDASWAHLERALLALATTEPQAGLSGDEESSSARSEQS